MRRKMKKMQVKPIEILSKSNSSMPSMFGPASFYDVLNPKGKSRSSKNSAEGRPKVVAFYGFKGGAGRSTAMGYAAALLANQGLYVIGVDLDLEAPGLAPLFGHDSDAAPLGSLHLLQQSAKIPVEQELGVQGYLLPVPDSIGPGKGKVDILPAGRMDDRYLAQLDELGIGLWHAFEPDQANPLRRLLEELSSLKPDVIFLDCRTGFSSLSATALFHIADIIVAVLPLSDQIWSGVKILMKGLLKSREQRGGAPELLLVPSLVLPGKEGDARLFQMVKRLQSLSDSILPLASTDENDDDEALSPVAILENGIKRRDSIWAEGSIKLPLGLGGDSELFKPLANWIGQSLGGESEEAGAYPFDRKKILTEIKLDQSAVFSERLSEIDMGTTLIDSNDSRAAVDRSVSLVIGAKGAGKTFLWRYLALPNRPEALAGVPTDVDFVVGLSPDPKLTPADPVLTAPAFQAIENECRLKTSGSHSSFWVWWSLQAIVRERPALGIELIKSKVFEPELRKKVQSFFEKPSSVTLIPILKRKNFELESEQVLEHSDKFLTSDPRSICLLFDGLDTGFQTSNPNVWPERRIRYVTGLLQMLSAWRSRLKRVQFKIFLREDIWVDVQMQNKSHLSAISHILHFEEKDLWKLVLKVVCGSASYKNLLKQMKIFDIPDDVETLRKALIPLWGLHNEKGKKAYTANYIIRRLGDSKERLFPRTILQMLLESIDSQKKSGLEGQPDRVLRFTSLRDGIDKASNQRVDDLKAEYVELGPYLDAMSGCDPVLPMDSFASSLRLRLAKSKGQALPKNSAIEQRVLPRLAEVGVLKIVPQDSKNPARIEVARIYRNGLKMKATKGLN